MGHRLYEYVALNTGGRKPPACLGGQKVDLEAVEDYGNLYKGVGRLRETHESLCSLREASSAPGRMRGRSGSGGRLRKIIEGARRLRETHDSLCLGYRRPPRHPGAPEGSEKLVRHALNISEQHVALRFTPRGPVIPCRLREKFIFC